MREPETGWLDKLKCRLGLHTWWIAPNAEVWLCGDDQEDVEEASQVMKAVPPDLVGHAKFCTHCRIIQGVIVNNQLVKLKGVKVVDIEQRED